MELEKAEKLLVKIDEVFVGPVESWILENQIIRIKPVEGDVISMPEIKQIFEHVDAENVLCHMGRDGLWIY